MNYVLSAKQMKELDQKTIDEFAIPSRVLMETAGKGCADLISDCYQEHLHEEIGVLCGTGNNGGDGAVIARWLFQNKHKVRIFKITDATSSPETQANMEICLKMGIPMVNVYGEDDYPSFELAIQNASLLIDAIFGIGFHGSASKFVKGIFERVNQAPAFKIAIDIPSGLDADKGVAEDAIYADATIAIDSYKLGHRISDGRMYCGQMHRVPIGIPRSYYEEGSPVIEINDLNHSTPQRTPYKYKTLYGRATIVAGSPGYTGAALMASQAALRAGAGYIMLLHRPGMGTIFEERLTEVLSFPILHTKDHKYPAMAAYLKQLESASAILIGPGLGMDIFAVDLVKYALEHIRVPIILDADALTIVSRNSRLYYHLADKNVLLTPHWGEFCRLAGIDSQTLKADCMGELDKFVRKYNTRVLLKSFTTIYHDENKTYISCSGNDGLATGGSGDVLGGIICSFVAQGMPIDKAAINASYLMGKTAEQLALTRVTPSITPTDIIANIFTIHPKLRGYNE
ncbi:MAG: bifunctional ADP-dependent NAD(P)H-hydrate dehydratase/NAD(P)H-hydrate epimerase [Candidatus Cloacimonetes bacterium HGW-Cloacimonetes-1]|jgi:NAD(P)H-hydrate epimerase|nr:MAG: bifunctional ADP-dependent NAD(P)H-hydrate dehydratase/NAD(P)H-hydrate epimerase [Candidatus Cloacimonetes bacterium HGW-Cloacimonetes-1]